MGYREKKSYLLAIFIRYKNASRSEKQKLLDELCAVCGYNRKYAIRLLKKGPPQAKMKTGPQSNSIKNQNVLSIFMIGWQVLEEGKILFTQNQINQALSLLQEAQYA